MNQIAERPPSHVAAPPSTPRRDRDRPARRQPERAPLARSLGDWWTRHPDLTSLGLILIVGLLFRLALLYRIPPLFMPGDSQSFLTPGYDLARGLGFDPILKRPLGYPLLIAAVILTLGEDLRGLVFIQAALGLVTVAATYFIGKVAFGRPVGALAALSVAVGGQLLVYEHYVLAESVSACLLALAVLALVTAVRGGGASWRLVAVGGVALAATSLFRPIAEVVLPILPVYFLATIRPPRRALLLTGVAIAAFVATMLPAMAADVMLRGGISSGALGEHLLWRITRADSGYITRDDVPPAGADSPESAARRYIIRKAVDRTLPQEIFEGLRREQGLSSSEADSIMRAVALEAIWRQGGRYVVSTLRMSVELFFGDDQPLGEISKKAGEAQYINPQARQRTWFEERVLHLGEPPSQAVENEFDHADMLISVYQPGRLLWLLAVGFVAGAVATVVSVRHRPALLLSLSLPPMLLANAALASPEARFRYPLDPLIAVLAFGGLAWLAQAGWRTVRQRRA